MAFSRGIRAVALALFLIWHVPVLAEVSTSEDHSRKTDAELTELREKLDALERRLGDLERRCSETSKESSADPVSSGRVTSGVEPTRLSDVRRFIVRGEGGPSNAAGDARLGALCRSALQGALASAGLSVSAEGGDADAEIVLTIAHTQRGRGFLGMTDESETVDVSYSAIVRSLPGRTLLMSHTDTEDGTPAEACRAAAEDIAKTIAKAMSPVAPRKRR